MDVMIPMWLMAQKRREINVMVLVGKSEDAACTLLGDIQAELQYNKRYTHDFGTKYNAGNWQDGEFVTSDGVAFFARGRGQSPRGLRYRNRRPDYIVIDDLDDDELCENDSRVRKLTEWVKEALFGAFGAEGGRFIMVGNLISKCSVLANIAASKGVEVSQVNVLDKNGKSAWPEYWTPERIQEKREFMGYRAFEKEYMNNPIKEGSVFRKDWIRWKKILPLDKYDEIVAYCDPSFKGSTKNDYKAIKVWGKVGTELHHIRAFVRQCSVAEMVRWFYDLHESLPEGVICKYMIEANFLQDTLLDDFEEEGNLRGYQLPIQADKRKNRTSSSVSKRYHRFGNVVLSFITRIYRMIRTCWRVSNRHFQSKKAAAHTMMAPTLMKVQSMYCRSIQEYRSLNRVSAHAGLLKIYGKMKQFIKDLILSYRIKRAIRLAEELSRVSKRRYLVLMVAGIPKVYSKQELKKMITQRKFRKGTTIQDLEKKAILITG